MSAPGVVFITGAASGIGRGLALRYAARGAKLALFGHHLDEAGIAGLRAEAGPDAVLRGAEIDMRDAEALKAAVEDAVAELGPPDLAINSAGITFNYRFEDISQEAFERTVAVNLFGSRNFAAAALPHMRPGSRLALVASVAGLIGPYGYAAYSASKFGVVGLAEVLRMEQKTRGVEVSVICPPEVDSPMVREERAHISRVALELKQIAGSIDIDTACDGVLRGLEAGRFVVIPTLRARALTAAARLFPGLSRAISDATVRRVLRKDGQG